MVNKTKTCFPKVGFIAEWGLAGGFIFFGDQSGRYRKARSISKML